MTRGGTWLLRGVGAAAAVLLVLVAAEASSAVQAGSWLAIPDLAELELTVVAALAVAAGSVVAGGRAALRLQTWTRVSGRRAWIERIVLIWCASGAAVLGAVPGLTLDLGPPALWPLGWVALAACASLVFSSESPRRVVWLLCACYGLTASSSLVVVRHVL